MDTIDFGEHRFEDEGPAEADITILGYPFPTGMNGSFLFSRDMQVETNFTPEDLFRMISIELARRKVQNGVNIYMKVEEAPNGDARYTWQTERFYDAPVSPELPDTFRR